MSTPRTDIHPKLREILDASGHEWSLERKRRHIVLRIDGVAVAAMPPNGWESGCRQFQNSLAGIRRALRQLGVPKEMLR